LALEAHATEGVPFPEFLDLIYKHLTSPEFARTEGLSINRALQMQTKRKYTCLPPA